MHTSTEADRFRQPTAWVLDGHLQASICLCPPAALNANTVTLHLLCCFETVESAAAYAIVASRWLIGSLCNSITVVSGS